MERCDRAWRTHLTDRPVGKFQLGKVTGQKWNGLIRSNSKCFGKNEWTCFHRLPKSAPMKSSTL